MPHSGPERRAATGGRRETDLAPQQQAAIAQALVAFGDLAAEESEEVAPLLHLIDACQVLAGNCEFSVLLRDDAGAFRVLGSSSDAVRVVDEQQIVDGNGPHLEVLTDAGSVLEVDFQSSEERWPRFTQLARVLGFLHLYAVPLQVQSEVIGLLNVFDRQEAGTPSVKMAWIRTLSTGAAASLQNRRSSAQLNTLAEQLQHALDSRVLIEQAKGVLATKLSVSIDEAFQILRGYSRSHNRKIRDVASEVIADKLTAAELRSPKPTAPKTP